jgi:cytochrome c oxidase assembly factor CtaG
MKYLLQSLRWLIITFLMLAACLRLSATPVAAHEGVPLPPQALMRMWDWESWSMAGLVLMAWLYSRGVRILWWRSGIGQVITIRQALAFNGGLTVLFIAFVSPLHALSADLFIAHTVQHLLLILLAAPLLLLGQASVALSWAIPKEIQRWWHYWWRQQRDLHLIGRFFLQPRISWIVYLVTLWLWQAPYVYKVAQYDGLVHLVQHGVLLATAMLFWRLLLLPQTDETLSPVLRFRFVATIALTGILLGTLITLTPPFWYPIYLPTAQHWGLTPALDQQLTGIVLLVAMSLVYLSLTIAYWRQVRQHDRATVATQQPAHLARSTAQ